MKEQLLAALSLHKSKNLLLLQHIPEVHLQASLPAKSRTVGEQLAHLHNNRIAWAEYLVKALYRKTDLLPKESVLPKQLLLDAFTTSAEIIRKVTEASWEKEGRLPSFKSVPIPFISYLISHESHHRGNILLTLKQTGFKLPAKLKWDYGSGNCAPERLKTIRLGFFFTILRQRGILDYFFYPISICQPKSVG